MSTTSHVPSDRMMRAKRLAGHFICQCNEPRPIRIGVWDGYECRACWHPILPHHQVVELIGQTLEHLDDA